MPVHETSKIVLRGFSWPTLFLLILIFLCIMVLTWRAVAHGGSRAWAAVLVLLRGVALVALCLAILQPEIVRRKTEILRSEIIVLHDGSMSMNLPSGADALSRQETVQKAFVAQPDFLDNIRRDFNVKFLEFGDKVLEGSEDMLLRAEGGKMPRTDLKKALKTVLDDHASDALEGVILVSDGADTELSSLPQQRHYTLDGELERLGIPVFTLCPVDGTALSDIALSGIRCSRLAFVRSRWKADVQISTNGLSSGRCHVVLRRRGNIVDIAQLNLRKNKTRYEVSLSFVPNKTGRTLLSFEVQPHPDETYHPNNRLGVSLNTVRDKIRVLQVGGRPSWDVRFLRRFLKQIPTVDLVSFFILRDQSDRPEPRGSVRGSYVNLIPFPTEELFTRELRTFDIIIFQNFDYRIFLGYRVDFPSYLENICEHVLKRGAGFIMIGGNQSFDRGPYAGTEIAQILPVDLKKGQGVP
ncbi:MAG: VWA domain-containing protein, partial [Planctomycetes bacterium]|nr:VWA domain-containing protein [Planctomycetota bacterium]